MCPRIASKQTNNFGKIILIIVDNLCSWLLHSSICIERKWMCECVWVSCEHFDTSYGFNNMLILWIIFVYLHLENVKHGFNLLENDYKIQLSLTMTNIKAMRRSHYAHNRIILTHSFWEKREFAFEPIVNQFRWIVINSQASRESKVESVVAATSTASTKISNVM